MEIMNEVNCKAPDHASFRTNQPHSSHSCGHDLQIIKRPLKWTMNLQNQMLIGLHISTKRNSLEEQIIMQKETCKCMVQKIQAGPFHYSCARMQLSLSHTTYRLITMKGSNHTNIYSTHGITLPQFSKIKPKQFCFQVTEPVIN